MPVLEKNAVRFVGYPGDIHFEIANHSKFDLTIDILNTNKEKINKIDLLRHFQTILIDRNEVLGCAMVLEEYITDHGNVSFLKTKTQSASGTLKLGLILHLEQLAHGK